MSSPPHRRLALQPGLLAAALALPLAANAVDVEIQPDVTSWQVPAGVTAIDVVALGGGGGAFFGGKGGNGGQVTVTNWPVTPGSTLQIAIGSGGAGPNMDPDPNAEPIAASLGGGATSLQNGSEWIIAGGGGGGGFNYMNIPGADLSGGDGCGNPGKGTQSIGGQGGANSQGGAAGTNDGGGLDPGRMVFGTAGNTGTGSSSGGVGTSMLTQVGLLYAGGGGGGWGGGGGGGLYILGSEQFLGGGGGGGATGDSCVPGTNGAIGDPSPPAEIPSGGAFAARIKSMASKADPRYDGGPGSLTITYAIPTSARLGGSISGLTAAGLVLASGGISVQTVAPAANASSFVFANPVTGPYAVTVQTQPAGLQCTVANGTGTVAADVNDVVVSCQASAPATATATPVPGLGVFALLMLSGLLGWLGMRRRS